MEGDVQPIAFDGLCRTDAADAYAGFGKLYEANRKGGPIIEAACWAHGRRKFFDLARLSKAPIAAEAVIATAKLNDIDPQAWFADVLALLPDHPARRIHELLPWNWRPHNVAHAA